MKHPCDAKPKWERDTFPQISQDLNQSSKESSLGTLRKVRWGSSSSDIVPESCRKFNCTLTQRAPVGGGFNSIFSLSSFFSSQQLHFQMTYSAGLLPKTNKNLAAPFRNDQLRFIVQSRTHKHTHARAHTTTCVYRSVDGELCLLLSTAWSFECNHSLLCH